MTLGLDGDLCYALPMVWYGMVWRGMVWYGMVWHGMYEMRWDGNGIAWDEME